ncbi:MAG: transcriptional regulator, Crp/Fnr family [Gammaproteobacteria bacterium]|nr:transcriptional regulator, Crp/Fnr family [Gammaproteobacteria bacterium]
MQANAARLISSLEHCAPLSSEEKNALEIHCGPVQVIPARSEIAREGDSTRGIHVIIEGFACRYRYHAGGRQQMVGLVLPGDICGVRACVLTRMDPGIQSLSTLRTALLSRESVLNLMDHFPRVARALWWSTFVEESITRAWLVNIGHRAAFDRMAHFFCEVFHRLQSVDLTRDSTFDLPLTQTDLGDALALSTVHVNRVLMEMRRRGLITFRNQQLTLHDPETLRRLADFDPVYLHLDNIAPTPVGEFRRGIA